MLHFILNPFFYLKKCYYICITNKLKNIQMKKLIGFLALIALVYLFWPRGESLLNRSWISSDGIVVDMVTYNHIFFEDDRFSLHEGSYNTLRGTYTLAYNTITLYVTEHDLELPELHETDTLIFKYDVGFTGLDIDYNNRCYNFVKLKYDPNANTTSEGRLN